ncbi:DUF4258 domain-containing protein [Thiohalocapsa marina]|uniref:DUF4258 domain-containing protein n=1 Tax=Thiohalocapsa marina TaxID=424902 RepID=A0A5M8FH62_9GAMM|nr:DUF4258 domain-containing protein [Thiohalocapsa marina]
MHQSIEGLKMSVHAEGRMRQRGFTRHDVELVCRYGTLVGDGLLMTQDAVRELCFNSGEQQRGERLLGAVAIVQGGTIVTVFHAERKWRRAQTRKGWSPRRHRRRRPSTPRSQGDAA